MAIRIEGNVSIGCVGPTETVIGPAEAFRNVSIKRNINYFGGGAHVQMFRKPEVIMSEMVIASDLPPNLKRKLFSELNSARQSRSRPRRTFNRIFALADGYSDFRKMLSDLAIALNVLLK